MNSHLDILVPSVVQDRASRISLTDRRADQLLAKAIEASVLGLQAVQSIPVPARDDRPAVVFHLVPLCGVARDMFNGCVAVLLGTPVVTRAVPGATVLQALFDLTAAEARIAEFIGRGETLTGAARLLGITVATARNQLSAVMAKCGLQRQSQLVGLLQGIRTPT